MRKVLMLAAVAALCPNLCESQKTKYKNTEESYKGSHGVRQRTHTLTHINAAIQNEPDNIMTTTHTCPEGYWLDNGMCIFKSEVDMISVCPIGSVEVDGMCEKSVPVQLSCDDVNNATQVNGMCVNNVVSEYILSCPEGYTEENDMCVYSITIQSACPEGTAPTNEGCVRFTPAVFTCEDGFELDGYACSQTNTLEPTYACPNTMILEDGVCVLTVNQPAVCPAGAVAMGDECLIYHSRELKCEDGYKLVDDICVQKMTEEPSLYCNNGGDPQDKCRVQVAVPKIPSCPEPSSTFVNDVCQTVTYVEPTFVCPEEYVLDNTTRACVKEIEYDCPSVEDEVECDAPSTVRFDKQEYMQQNMEDDDDNDDNDDDEGDDDDDTQDSPGVVRMLGVDKKSKGYKKRSKKINNQSHTHTHGHIKPQEKVNLPVCRIVKKITEKTCVRKINAQREPVCEEGSTYTNIQNSDMCQTITVTAPEFICSAMSSEQNGDCYVEETSLPLKQCNEGFQLQTAPSPKAAMTHQHYKLAPSSSKQRKNHHEYVPASNVNVPDMCVMVSKYNAVYECPPDTTGDNCEAVVEKECPGGSCVVSVSQPPRFVCPSGYVLQETQVMSTHSHGSKTVSIYDHAKKNKYSNSHTHNKAVVKQICSQTVNKLPAVSCDDTADLLDEITCVSYEDYEQSPKTFTTPITKTCAEGLVDSGQGCVSTSDVPATPNCADGYLLDTTGMMCVQQVEPQRGCPQGSTHEKGTCWVFSEADPYLVDTVLRVSQNVQSHHHAHHSY